MPLKVRNTGSRNHLVPLVASLMVILFGMFACITIAVVGSNDPKNEIILVVVFFGMVGLVPILCMRPPKAVMPSALRERGSVWRAIAGLFQRSHDKDERIRTWKRKKTDFVPQPHGAEYITTFIRDRAPDEHRRDA